MLVYDTWPRAHGLKFACTVRDPRIMKQLRFGELGTRMFVHDNTGHVFVTRLKTSILTRVPVSWNVITKRGSF